MLQSIRRAAFFTFVALGTACSSADGGSVGASDEAFTQTSTPAPIERQRVRLMKAASPAAWARAGAVSAQLKLAMTTEGTDPLSSAMELARGSFALDGTSASGADIEALCFIVLMEAANEAQSDLKSIMAGVKAINAAKQKQREILAKLQADASANANAPNGPLVGARGGCIANLAACLKLVAPADADAALAQSLVTRSTGALASTPATLADLRTAEDALKAKLDSMSEMGEMESLRLQMAMDRLSKMMSTLSNVLKKISDTDSSIVQNMK